MTQEIEKERTGAEGPEGEPEVREYFVKLPANRGNTSRSNASGSSLPQEKRRLWLPTPRPRSVVGSDK